MLHCVHQLAANVVCLLFNAGQVAYSVLIKASSLNSGYDAEESGKVGGHKAKTMSWQYSYYT